MSSRSSRSAGGRVRPAGPRPPASDARRRRDQRGAHARRVLGRADHVDADVGGDRRTARPSSSPRVLACSAAGGASAPATARARGPTSDSSPRSSVRLCSSRRSRRCAAHHVEERLERRALGVEQQLLAGAGRAGRRASCPCASAAPRSSRWPGSSASTSLVTWPCRNASASAPVSASLPRSERSSRPQPSRDVGRSRCSVACHSEGHAFTREGTLLGDADGPGRHLHRRWSSRCPTTGRTSSSTCGSSTRTATSRPRPAGHRQRPAVLEARLALAAARRPPLRPCRRGPAVHGTLKLLDDSGIDGELAVREVRAGRVEITQRWGRPESVRRSSSGSGRSSRSAPRRSPLSRCFARRRRGARGAVRRPARRRASADDPEAALPRAQARQRPARRRSPTVPPSAWKQRLHRVELARP